MHLLEQFGMKKSKSDHLVFYRRSISGIILLVYVDIVITNNDTSGILSLNLSFKINFTLKIGSVEVLFRH